MNRNTFSLRTALVLMATCGLLAAKYCPEAAAVPLRAVEIDIVLETGSVARSHVPVSIELPVGEDISETVVSQLFNGYDPIVRLKDGRKTVPGQLERMFDAEGSLTGLRLSWILNSAEAAERKRYVARITPGNVPTFRRCFHFEDVPGKYLDCLFGDRPVYRYVCEFDPARFHDTYKPFHHVYDFDGENFITKGPGGHDSHHRGMYIGWSEVKVGNSTYNLWAMSDRSYQRHMHFVDRETSAGPVLARRVAIIDWMNPDGEPLIRERREAVVYKQPSERHLFDMMFHLETLKGPIQLPGSNLHHAGFQFRAAEEVVRHGYTTKYIIPKGSRRVNDSVTGPWCVQSPVVLEKRYAIQHMDHPWNPRPTVYSTRQYGRFGAFFRAQVEPGKPVRCQYRVAVSLVNDSTDLEVDGFETVYANYVQPLTARIVAIKIQEQQR